MPQNKLFYGLWAERPNPKGRGVGGSDPRVAAASEWVWARHRRPDRGRSRPRLPWS